MRKNNTKLLSTLITLFHLTLGSMALWAQTPVGTAIVYQGKLDQAGITASGTFDFEFALFDEVELGIQIGTTLVYEDLVIDDGIFTVDLDFGDEIFVGEALWLEIGVREGTDTGQYTLLTPRQRISAAPFALHSDRAETAEVAETANLLDGRSSTDFLLTTGGTITGDLVVEGALSGELDTASLPTVTTPTIYTPAKLICGELGESDPAQWSFITGALKIMIDDADYEISMGFSGVSTMTDVAESIQSALRMATGRQETVVWSTDHFEIESANMTFASSIGPAMAPMSAPGIDVSGQTAGNNWMDCDAERAQVIDSTPNPGAYAGNIPLLNSNGTIDHRFLEDTTAAVVTGESFLVDEISGPGRYVFEIPVGFIGANTFELLATQFAIVDLVGGCNQSASATLMKLKGKVGGPILSLYRQGTDSDCPPDPLPNVDLSITSSGNPSISSDLSALDMTTCRGAECIHSSILSISALPDGTNLLVEILIEEENISVTSRWDYQLSLRYLYTERQ